MTSTASTAPAAPATTPDVFISHAHADNEKTELILAALKAAGFNTWIDLDRLEAGANWSKEIQDGLITSRAGLIVLSQKAVESVACQGEHYYLTKKYENKQIRLYVVVLEPFTRDTFPYYLNAIQYEDLSADFDAKLAKLVATMRKHLLEGVAPDLPVIASDAPQTANASATLITDPDDVPFAPRRLIGRDAALTTVTGWLDDPDGARGLIQAHGGAGKTALTAKALQTWLETQSDARALWITAGRADAAAIFAAIGQALNNAQALAAVPDDQQPNVVKSLLRAAQIQAVVLDDCWNAAALGRTLKAIPGKIPVLVTSRQRQVENMTAQLELPDLAPDDAVTMLGYHAGRTLDPADARAVCAKVGNLAFAVEIAGKLLKKRDHWTAADLLKTVDVLTQPRPETDDPETGRESVNALIEASLNALEDDAAKAVFLAFGAFPSPQLTAELLMQFFIGEPEVDDDMMASVRADNPQTATWDDDTLRNAIRQALMNQIDPAPADAALITLRDSGLATFVPGEVVENPDTGERLVRRNPAYRVHDLAHAYAAARVDRAAADRATAACLTLTRRYNQPGWTSFRALLPVLDALSGAAARAFEREQWQTAEDFAWGLYRGNQILDYLGYYDLSLRLLTSAAAAAAKQGNTRDQGVHLNHLGLVYAGLGRVREAIAYYEQSLTAARTAGNRQDEGNALGNLGNAYASLGEYSRAIDYHEQRLAIAREIGDRRGEGNSLGSLGNAYDSLGEYRRAIDYHEQSLAIKREIGDRRGEGNALGNLGIAYASLGEYRRAIDYHEQALVISREIGDRAGEGADLGNLGNAYDSLGEYRRAIEYHEQHAAIAREIGDRRGEGNALGNLGNAYADLGEYRRAIDYHEQALVISREIGDRAGEGADLGNLGNAYARLGEYRRAIEYHEQSLAIKREIGDRGGEANSLNNLGAAYEDWTDGGDLNRALDYYQQARVILEAIGQMHRVELADRNIARVQAKLSGG